MARGKTITLSTLTFNTQTEATKYFSDMLKKYKPGDRIDDADSAILYEMIARHPEYHEKVGCGVSHFELMATMHGSNCFRVVRTDGTGTDFSIGACIKGEAPSLKQQVNAAFRQVVKFDIYKVRDQFIRDNKDAAGKIVCAVTKQKIDPADAHIDHRAPMTFDVIVTTFLAAHGLAYEDVPLSRGNDEQVVPEITDAALKDAFRKAHNTVATIDLVAAKENLKAAAPNRIKKNARLKL